MVPTRITCESTVGKFPQCPCSSSITSPRCIQWTTFRPTTHHRPTITTTAACPHRAPCPTPGAAWGTTRRPSCPRRGAAAGTGSASGTARGSRCGSGCENGNERRSDCGRGRGSENGGVTGTGGGTATATGPRCGTGEWPICRVPMLLPWTSLSGGHRALPGLVTLAAAEVDVTDQQGDRRSLLGLGQLARLWLVRSSWKRDASWTSSCNRQLILFRWTFASLQLRHKFSSTFRNQSCNRANHKSVTVHYMSVTSQSQAGHMSVTSQSQVGHKPVTSWSQDITSCPVT